MKKKQAWISAAVVLFAVVAIVALRLNPSGGVPSDVAEPAAAKVQPARSGRGAAQERSRTARGKAEPIQQEKAPEQGDEVAGIPEEEPETDPAEKAVKAFEALTDSLMEPVKGDISMAQIDAFVNAFKALPEKVREEELHHALNLLPDENSLYLLGILMDTSLDKALTELVFNDFLNRGDEVKQPMLKAVFKQKSHPCWADAAWILDVTGALPAQKAQ